MKRGIELFCGSASISKEFTKYGIEFITVDIRKRKGVCEPTHRIDISKVDLSFFNDLGKFDIIWVGFPCTAFSYASRDIYYKAGQFLESARYFLELLEKTQIIVDILKRPDTIIYFENPRGRLRHYQNFIDYCKLNNLQEYTLTYSSYGNYPKKPTNIFTNAKNIKFRDLDSYGRGSKSLIKFDNLTLNQRQSYPKELVNYIVTNYIQNHYHVNTNYSR